MKARLASRALMVAVCAASFGAVGTLMVCAQPGPATNGADGERPAAAPSSGGRAGAPAPAAKAPPATVRIVFTVLPPTKKAMVFWGKRKLGPIAPHQPLTVQRPRDSGPLDVIVRSDDCVPVQTRAYTFADNKVAVKLTPLDQKNTLLGYREELPPPSPDGGAPSSSEGGWPAR